MDEKTLKLKEKKLRLEYRFLSAEMEEVEHILKEADEEIKKVFKKLVLYYMVNYCWIYFYCNCCKKIFVNDKKYFTSH